jgi:hypothetical protein
MSRAGSYVNADGVLLAQLGLIGRFWQSSEFLFINTRHENQSSQTVPGAPATEARPSHIVFCFMNETGAL